MYTARLLCDVLSEMRMCVETLNFASLKSLIEEAQTLGNRMEAGLDEKRQLLHANIDYEKMKMRQRTLKRNINALELKIAKLENKHDKLSNKKKKR